MSASPARLFRRLYGGGPFHLLGHLAVIAITAYALSVMFEARFAPQPLNLALWLLGGAVLHDAVFLPLYGVAWFGLARLLGAGDGLPLKDRILGRPAPAAAAGADRTADDAESSIPHDGPTQPTSRDGRRRVPLVNFVRVPLVLSAVLLLVFLPRILDRQPQNFVNALGHGPPDFLGRWIAMTVALVIASALAYAVSAALATRRP